MDRNVTNEKQLLSIPQISVQYNISKYTVRRFLQNGLPSVKTGRKVLINRNTFENFIKGGFNNANNV